MTVGNRYHETTQPVKTMQKLPSTCTMLKYNVTKQIPHSNWKQKLYEHTGIQGNEVKTMR